MRATLLMTWHDLRIFFAHKGNWVGLLVLPILMTLVFGFAVNRGVQPEMLRVDVIDQDATEDSARLLADLDRANNTLLLCPQEDEPGDRCALADQPLTLETGLARVRAGESAALIVIPAGYAAALAADATLELEFYSTAEPFAPDPVRQSLETVVQQINSAALTAQVVGAVLDRIDIQPGADAGLEPGQDRSAHSLYTTTRLLLAERPPAVRYVEIGHQPARQGQGFGQAVPGMGSMFVLFTVLGGMAALQRERRRWTLQRLAALPLRRGQILGSKMLTYFTLGLLQYGLAFAVGLAVGFDFGPKPFLLLPVVAAFALCCTGITFALAPLLHSERQAGVVAQILALTFAALGGAWWPLEVVPRYMQRLGHLSPVAWAMDAFRTLLFYGGGWVDILPQLAVLMTATVVLLGLGIWRFRYV